MKSGDLRTTWPRALLVFLSPILFIMMMRWLLLEPFVIPSGSMIPTLLVHDNIFVNKLKYGIKVPFGNQFIVRWDAVHRGDVVVFRWPENTNVFFVKRVVAVAGDQLQVEKGVLKVNGQVMSQESVNFKNGDESFEYFSESFNSSAAHTVRYKNRDFSNFGPVSVAADTFFVMGDNRDQSNDSRFWGAVPEQNIVGQAMIIWLSCDQTLSSARFLCDPQSLRTDRIFKRVQ